MASITPLDIFDITSELRKISLCEHSNFFEDISTYKVRLYQILKKSWETALICALLVSVCTRHTGTPLSVNRHTCLVLPIHLHNSSTAGYDWAFLCSVPESSGDEDAHSLFHTVSSCCLSFLDLLSHIKTNSLEEAHFQGTSRSSIIQIPPMCFKVFLTFLSLLSYL